MVKANRIKHLDGNGAALNERVCEQIQRIDATRC
jgi:hypothetical protein